MFLYQGSSLQTVATALSLHVWRIELRYRDTNKNIEGPSLH